MLRMTAIALAAVATVGVASLASTAPAAAGWHGHHHHKHVHIGFRRWHAPIVVVGDYGCWRKRFIDTPYGVIVKRVNVCY